MTTVNQLRNTYLKFFEKNGHKIVPSSSLVPNNDPTLMFTNAGMVQFKNVFIGNETRDYKRATTSQKCVRAGGKHNDLDNVGYTVRHHTFFEMLGNFSFGDYFKEDAIKFAWDLVTKELGFPKERLVATVYHNDDEAYNIWKKVAGLKDEQLVRIATKDNFWQMGDVGPCGPCSEIFFDHGDKIWGGLPGTPEEDGDRYIEIWNNVFMQFEDLSNGSRISLPKPSIDTGMGLERTAAILQGVHSNYEIDLFKNIIEAICKITGSDAEGPLKSSHNVIADHLRSICFLIADGVMPSNEGRGYVLRRIMRRAMRHAHLLGQRDPMIYKLLPVLQKEMGEAYPELYRADALITEILKMEENRFIKTLENGLRLLDDEVEQIQTGKDFDGKTAFKLYDTYGFPLDLTQDVLRAKDIKVDVEAFNNAMEEQKAQARKSWSGSGDAGTAKVWFELQDKLGITEFLGYHSLSSDCLIKEVLKIDDNLYVIANQTPFYGESGGQLGDVGIIRNSDFVLEVLDTKKKLDGLIVHQCRVLKGEPKAGVSASFEVDSKNRNAIAANHSVTHLVHRALRDILGAHVSQKGSSVGPKRMRFDISHPKQITAEELKMAENIVNDAIRANYDVVTKLVSPEEAIKSGAMALFGEKYGEEVRMVSMQKECDKFSVELCGGTHVKSTGDIGYFNIVSESAVGAGIRRIECVTGKAAEEFAQNLENTLLKIGQLLKTTPDEIEHRIKTLQEDKKKLEAEIFELKKIFVSHKTEDNKEKIDVINGVNFVGKVLPKANSKELKSFVDGVMEKMNSGVVVLASSLDDKASIVVGVSKDMTSRFNAVDLVRVAAVVVGGNGGGGRPDMAQAGGPDATQLENAIKAIQQKII